MTAPPREEPPYFVSQPVAQGAHLRALAPRKRGPAPAPRAADLLKRRIDPLARLDEALHRSDRLLEHRALVARERHLDDALDAARANDDRYADIHVVDPVLARQMSRAGQDALLVLEIALGHGDGRGGGRVEGGARLQKVDDLAAPFAGALDDG